MYAILISLCFIVSKNKAKILILCHPTAILCQGFVVNNSCNCDVAGTHFISPIFYPAVWPMRSGWHMWFSSFFIYLYQPTIMGDAERTTGLKSSSELQHAQYLNSRPWRLQIQSGTILYPLHME